MQQTECVYVIVYVISGEGLRFYDFLSLDGWLLGKDTADVPLGLETTDTLCVSCWIGDKRPEEEKEDLKLPQRSKTLLRTRLRLTH